MKILMSRQPRKTPSEIRKAIEAKQPVSDREMWRLVFSGKLGDKLFALCNCNDLSQEILDTLSDDPDRFIRFEVARHPNISDETLDKLLHDTSYEVRAAATNSIFVRDVNHTYHGDSNEEL